MNFEICTGIEEEEEKLSQTEELTEILPSNCLKLLISKFACSKSEQLSRIFT